MKRNRILNWAFSTIGVAILTFLIVLLALGPIFNGLIVILSLPLDSLDFQNELKLISSLVLIEILFLGIKECLNHHYPEGHKPSKAMIIVGWCCVGIFCLSLLADITALFSGKMPIASIRDFSGIDVILPGVFFSWWYYFTKCGPTYILPKWKRYLKAFLFILLTLVILNNSFTPAVVSWICVIVVYCLMLILIAMQTDYISPVEQQITEEIDL